MEHILAEEAPYAPLLHWNRFYLVHPTVRGWRSNPLGHVDWRELWLAMPRISDSGWRFIPDNEPFPGRGLRTADINSFNRALRALTIAAPLT
jgi:hypothetical protein